MSEDKYRLFKAILAAALVVGMLAIAYRFAENGRYQQIDYNKQPTSGAQALGGPAFFDTRTGERR